MVRAISVALGCLLTLWTIGLASADPPTITSTGWEFLQIEKSIVERENRVKGLIGEILPKINSTIDSLKSNGALSSTVTALQNLRSLINALSTVSTYGVSNSTISCDDVAVKISNIRFDIARCYKTNAEVVVNATLLFIRVNNLNAALVVNYLSMTDDQRQSVQSIITSSNILLNEYNQYSVTLIAATYKYSQIHLQFVNVKNTFCSCSTQLSKSSTTALATVDDSLQNIQASVDGRETKIRNISVDTISKIKTINPDLKRNSALIMLTTTLDTISTLLTGYQILTTTSVINATLTCDDASMKVALIQYKAELYFETSIEAQKNATFVLTQLNSLNAYYAANLQTLTDSQKQSIQAVITSLSNLTEEFRQYIMALTTAIVRLLSILNDARSAKDSGCNCSQSSSETTTTQKQQQPNRRY